MSILGTCPECLHYADGMCNLRPRICFNYDHFERLPTVTLSRDVFETQYISRATFDAEVARLTALSTMKDDALASYAEFYERAASLCGLPEYVLPANETDEIILQRLAEHNEVARLTELQQAASEFIGYIKAGNNAKAHLQMLFLEVLINEESKNGAKK